MSVVSKMNPGSSTCCAADPAIQSVSDSSDEGHSAWAFDGLLVIIVRTSSVAPVKTLSALFWQSSGAKCSPNQV